MTDNIMGQRVKSVLKFVRSEVSLHINGTNLISKVTLPNSPVGSPFIQITLSPAHVLLPSLHALLMI